MRSKQRARRAMTLMDALSSLRFSIKSLLAKLIRMMKAIKVTNGHSFTRWLRQRRVLTNKIRI